MFNLGDITRDDANTYFRNCFAITKKGTPVLIRQIENGGSRFMATCYIKGTDRPMWERSKDFDLDKLILVVPKMGYINDYETNKVIYTQRRVGRTSTRLLSNEGVYAYEAVSGRRVDVLPSLVRQLFQPNYTPADTALAQILVCKAPAVAISSDMCLMFSPTTDGIVLKVNETPAAYYEPESKSFKLIADTVDYREQISKVFGGRLNVTF